jgi:hypothetical protein
MNPDAPHRSQSPLPPYQTRSPVPSSNSKYKPPHHLEACIGEVQGREGGGSHENFCGEKSVPAAEFVDVRRIRRHKNVEFWVFWPRVRHFYFFLFHFFARFVLWVLIFFLRL